MWVLWVWVQIGHQTLCSAHPGHLWGPDTNDFFGEVDVLVGVARQRLALLEDHVENAANWVLNHLKVHLPTLTNQN